MSGLRLFISYLIVLIVLIGLIVATPIFLQTQAAAQLPDLRTVEVVGNQLIIDGKTQPQLFGAEVQYFRLRGGYGPNIPRAEVIALWNKALDRLVQAKMNAISFYIPWDFHEYAEGQFDFTGTADSDGDGRADYPSRDLMTFFKLIADHDITRIMVRPGPYINAEWGFLGFGAIPKWFHDKYPNSHMRTSYGLRNRLYDYRNPDLIRQTGLWFTELYEQVLKTHMGPAKPIVFIQLDNETNYQWQSLDHQDFSQSSISRYQRFVEDLYYDITTLNQNHGRKWDRWSQVQPPSRPGRNTSEDRDWYRFADQTIYHFLFDVRNLWERLGVVEPKVLFTLAESYNAPENGLLPNFIYRNAPHTTGLMTVNLYPKTAEESHYPMLNFPFKADLDVKAADEANDSYFGSQQEWALGPEIQGGWWEGIEVSPESRRQTYLTVLGHGLKAFFIYYFSEGQNWDVEWSYEQIKTLFDKLRYELRMENIAIEQLPELFWNELQSRTDRKILVGFDVRRVIRLGPNHNTELFFDAPLDGKANPRNHYFHIKQIGENIVAPYQDFLSRALEALDPVALVKDSTSHQPVADPNLPSVQASADWTGGLLGYLMNSDLNPRILHGDLSSEENFKKPKLLAHLDTGLNAPRTLEMLKQALNRGQMVLNFLASDIPKFLGIESSPTLLFGRSSKTRLVPLVFYINSQGDLRSASEPDTRPVQMMSSAPIYSYHLSPGCEGILYSGESLVGYRCKRGETSFVQIGALLFEDYNSSAYAQMVDSAEHKIFLKAIINRSAIKPQLLLSNEAKKTVAFARKDPEKKLLWITVKTGLETAQSIRLKVSAELLDSSLAPALKTLLVTDLLSQKTQTISAAEISQKGFQVNLGPNDSTVFVLKYSLMSP